MTEAANGVLKGFKKGNLVVENMTIYFLKPVQMDSMLEIHPHIIEAGRKFGKVDVEIFNEGKLVGKALLTCQILNRR